jgi:flagellar hook-associated protein 3 FlgL
MKISTHQMFERASQQMSQVQNSLAKSQAELSQGKQVLNPSDAPDQAATIQRLKSILSKQDSYQAGLNSVQSRLEGEDSTLQSVSNLLMRVKEVSIQANNDTLSPANRKAIATELQAVRDQLLSLANTRDNNGNYLFSGSRVSQPAFSGPAGTSPVYNGDQTKMYVPVSEQRSIPTNRTGTDVFVSVSRTDTLGVTSGVGFFQAMDDLIAGVSNSNHAGMSRGIGEMDTLLQGLSLAQATVGSDLKVIDQQTTVIESTVLNLKTTLSNVEDLDYASAITKMNQQMLSLEAAQSSFAKMSQLNLFNYLK